MFDNHIQNIWVAQRKRGEEKNKEIEGEKEGATRVEEKGAEKVEREEENKQTAMEGGREGEGR